MKKTSYIVAFVTLILLGVISFFIGIFIYKTNRLDELGNSSHALIEDECTKFGAEYEMALLANEREEKTSPNAIIITKTEYKECGHTIKKIEEIKQEYVNMTKADFAKEYIKNDKLKLENFSSKEIVIIEESEGSCNQHYIVKEKDGKIIINKINNKNEEIFERETGITTEYLTDTDIIKLKYGIKANGEQELNSVLEDFE